MSFGVLRRHRDFAMVWTGQVVSVLGDGMNRAALLWWAKVTTNSNAVVALTAVASAAPIVVLSPLTGVWADRWDRRRLMMAADGLRLALSVLLAVLLFGHHLTPAVLYVVAAAAACGEAVFAPAFSASITQLVPEDDRLAANGLNLVNSAVGGLAGPAVGGLLIATVGTGWVLVADAASFAWSVVLVGAATVPPLLRADRVATSARDDLTQGWRIVARRPALRRLVGLAAALNFFAAPLPVLVVALTVGVLRLGAAAYGLLDACIAGGVLLGALGAARLAGRRPDVALGRALVLVGLATGTAGAVAVLPWAAGCLVLVGGGAAVANTVLPTRFQRDVEPELQGRVFGVAGAAAVGLRPFGLLFAAPLLAALGERGAFAACGVAFLGAALLGRPEGELVVVPQAHGPGR